MYSFQLASETVVADSNSLETEKAFLFCRPGSVLRGRMCGKPPLGLGFVLKGRMCGKMPWDPGLVLKGRVCGKTPWDPGLVLKGHVCGKTPWDPGLVLRGSVCGKPPLGPRLGAEGCMCGKPPLGPGSSVCTDVVQVCLKSTDMEQTFCTVMWLLPYYIVSRS